MVLAKGNEIKSCVLREEKICVQNSRFCPAISYYPVEKIDYTDKTYKKISKCSNYCVDAK